MTTICLVDDQQISIDAVSLILQNSKEIKIIGTFSSAEDLIANFDELQPDITLMDIDLPGVSGIEAVLLLKYKNPVSKFLILTNFSDDDRVFDALRSGADGYILKKDAYGNLENALLSIKENGAPITPEIAKKLIVHFQKNTGINSFIDLTDKERKVLLLLVDGLLYKEIAEKIALSIDSVKKITRSVYQKLHVRTRSEAIRKFLSES
jgi:DNA-binding NarL/FixJ family response regulator